MTAERDALKNQLLRTMADFDNYRKRATREKQDERRGGKEEILRELLPVFDNLERAAAFSRSASDVKAIADGVSMVLKLFADTLTRLGGKRLQSVGAPFDPNVHEALQQVEHPEHPAGTVVQEFAPGYLFADRLLRAAMVVVSKGPPAVKEPAPEVPVVDEAVVAEAPDPKGTEGSNGGQASTGEGGG
ncbi:MAG: nucleotide exchange factor GrpE [Deltaproteobacteria bacterium]|nr:nucleotide exchange factor GrpE [Deltaproteobacteria bacterium]